MYAGCHASAQASYQAVYHCSVLQSLVLEQRGGVWGAEPVNGWQLLAGLALSTVTDSLMRALRHVAYLTLYSYQRAVKRKQVGTL